MLRRVALRMAASAKPAPSSSHDSAETRTAATRSFVSFFWLGLSVTIDSVTDFVTDASSTPARNTYQRFESVSAGGISMATYVSVLLL